MMLGNAVCPPTMKAAVERLLEVTPRKGTSAPYNETMPGRVR